MSRDLFGRVIDFSVSATEVSCGECGIPFSIPTNLYDKLRESHKTFYCPNGHSRYFPAKTDAEKLKDELEQKKNMIAQLSTTKIQLENQLNKANRKLKRVAAGQCPCCDKSYKHLANHMARKHPEVK